MAKEKFTSEQRQAIKLQQEQDKYRGYCTESILFTQKPENIADLKKLADKIEQAKQLKEDIEELKYKIYDNMTAVNCRRALLLSYGKQVTISSSGYTSTKHTFDVDSFKKKHPDLYKKYSTVSGKHYSSGERFTFSSITPKAEGFYRQLPEYFQVEKPQVEHEWKFGDVFSIPEFRNMILSGLITDYDGVGNYLGEDGTVSNNNFDLDDLISNSYPKQYHWVIWFNK